MGNCFSSSAEEDKSKTDKLTNSGQAVHNGEVEFPQSSESSTQPALTESAVQSVGSDISQPGVRRPSSVLNAEKHLEKIHEGRQESFHSAVSVGSFASAVSNLSSVEQPQSALPVLKKRLSGKEHHEGFPTDYIPNDELTSFWQPMCLISNEQMKEVGSYRATTNHGFQISGHKVNIVQENGHSSTFGGTDTVPTTQMDTSVQGCKVSESICFRISEPAKELTCIKRVTKGVMQFTLTEYMGDYEVGEHKYEFPQTNIPKGPFSRGQYHVVTTFVDIHGDELFSCVGDFKVVKSQIPKLPINGLLKQKI